MNILDRNWKILRFHVFSSGEIYLLNGCCGIWAVIVEKDDNLIYSATHLSLRDASSDYKDKKDKVAKGVPYETNW